MNPHLHLYGLEPSDEPYTTVHFLIVAAEIMCVTPALVDDTQPTDMQILIDNVKADTKHVFGGNMN